MKLTEQQIKNHAYMSNEDILENLRVTRLELEGLDSQLNKLDPEINGNAVSIEMKHMQIGFKEEFINELNQIYLWRKKQKTDNKL